MKKSVISYGAYIPYQRITRDEYVNSFGRCGAEIKEKAVPDIDEDVITMAVEAAKKALAGIDTGQVGVLTLASANFPYQEKLMTGTLVDALGLKDNVTATQHSNSTLAGAEAFYTASALLDDTGGKYALVVAADVLTASLDDNLEHGLGAAACAFVLARDEPGLAFQKACEVSRDFPGQRFRRSGDTMLRDIGVRKYTVDTYQEIVKQSIERLFSTAGKKAGDFRHVVLPVPGVKDAQALARKTGFSEEQIKNGVIYPRVGDTGASLPFLALCNVLDHAAAGDEILLCAYAAGAGAYTFNFVLDKPPQKQQPLEELLADRVYISFMDYLKLKKHI